jgi:magnesium-transporting ATPase (P-type)
MIPESLIAVLTITFVTGMTQMRKRKVLTRKLSALEALGGITNICSDKTGTLTQGQMTVRKAWIPESGIYTISNTEDPANPTQGNISVSQAKSRAEMDAEKSEREERFDRERSGAALTFEVPHEKAEKDQQRRGHQEEKKSVEDEDYPEMVPDLEAFLNSAALCNLATVRLNEQEGKYQTTGDPTEVALQVFAHRFDRGKKFLEDESGWKQITEYPFDSSVKRMSVVYRSSKDEIMVFTKGAVERVIDLCDYVGTGENRRQMTESVKESIYEQMTMLADQGLRVLALAQKNWEGDFHPKSDIPRDDIEKDLTLLGLAGLYDPPRLETKDAVRGTFLSSTLFLSSILTQPRMHKRRHQSPHAHR